MKKALLTTISLIAAVNTAAAQTFGSLGSFRAADIRATSPGAVRVDRPNYYLDQNSYDPLLGPVSAAASNQKISVIGGTIDIPGTNGDLTFARQYRQVAYARHDLQSDVSLTVYTKGVAKTLLNILLGNIQDNGNPAGGTYSDINPVVVTDPALAPREVTEAQIDAQNIPADEKERLKVILRNSKLQLEGRVNPFKVREMLNMYTQIMVEERAKGIEPKFGEAHEWSPEFMSYCRRTGEMIPLGFSKLLVALASGVTSRHFKTGQELPLINYLLSRAEGSVTMDEMFRKSYQLNNGDVYLAILTSLNILSDNWRHPQRDQLAVTRKLAPICNFYQNRGDKYGAWYHFQGIMLYGYVAGGFKAWLVGGIETAGSHVLGGANDQNEQQEDYVNATGGKVGAKLAKIVRNREYVTFRPHPGYVNPSYYLDLSEDWRDRIEYVESREFSTSLDENRMWLKALYRDYLDCHVEIIYNDDDGKLDSRNIVKYDHVDFKKGKDKPLFVTWDYGLEIARAFIRGCKGGMAPAGNKSMETEELPAFYIDAVRAR